VERRTLTDCLASICRSITGLLMSPAMVTLFAAVSATI
jgi:hypothetical protein